MEFKNLLERRYSCRKISDSKVDDILIDRLVEVANMAPTAVNKQPFKIFLMNSTDAKEAIRLSTKHTFGADTFLVVGYRPDESWIRKYDEKNFGIVDASIVSTYIMLEICNLGLDTTWVGHFDQGILKERFVEMNDYELITIFPIGYAEKDSKPAHLHYERKKIEDIVTKL